MDFVFLIFHKMKCIYQLRMTNDMPNYYWNFACLLSFHFGQRIYSLRANKNNKYFLLISFMVASSFNGWCTMMKLFNRVWINVKAMEKNANVIIEYGHQCWKLSSLSLHWAISLSIRSLARLLLCALFCLSFRILRNSSSDNTFTISCNEFYAS